MQNLVAEGLSRALERVLAPTGRRPRFAWRPNRFGALCRTGGLEVWLSLRHIKKARIAGLFYMAERETA